MVQIDNCCSSKFHLNLPVLIFYQQLLATLSGSSHVTTDKVIRWRKLVWIVMVIVMVIVIIVVVVVMLI